MNRNGPPDPHRIWTALLKIGIALYLLASLVSALPMELLAGKNFADRWMAVVGPLGWNQRWKMFAPEPIPVNVELVVDFVFADGKASRWVASATANSFRDDLTRGRWKAWLAKERAIPDHFDVFTSRLVKRLFPGQAGQAKTYLLFEPIRRPGIKLTAESRRQLVAQVDF